MRSRKLPTEFCKGTPGILFKAIDCKISGSGLVILMYLTAYWDDESDTVYNSPSVSQIALDLNLSVSTAYRAISELKKAGFVEGIPPTLGEWTLKELREGFATQKQLDNGGVCTPRRHEKRLKSHYFDGERRTLAGQKKPTDKASL